MSLNSVDLPEPDGPITATISPLAHVEIYVFQNIVLTLVHDIGLAKILYFENIHNCFFLSLFNACCIGGFDFSCVQRGQKRAYGCGGKDDNGEYCVYLHRVPHIFYAHFKTH